MARPPLPADERRTYKLQISFTTAEQAAIQAAADRAQVTFSEFVRTAAVEKARHNKPFKPTGRKRPSA